MISRYTATLLTGWKSEIIFKMILNYIISSMIITLAEFLTSSKFNHIESTSIFSIKYYKTFSVDGP